MDQFDPNKILDQQFGEEETALRTTLKSHAGKLKEHRRRLLESMNEEYKVERKYIEQTPMDYEQRYSKILQLNQKYELKMVKLDQELEPHVLELEQAEVTGMSRLTARRREADQRLRIVQELVDKGHVPEQSRTAVLQEQLQAVGVNVPANMFKPPREETVQGQLNTVRARLSAIDDVLGAIAPSRSGKTVLNKDGTLRKDALYAEIKGTKGRLLTEEERQRVNQLLAQRRDLEGLRSKILEEANIGPLTVAMNVAGSQQRGTPLSSGVEKLARPSAPKSVRQTMTNPKTGQQYVSDDGGKTWQPAKN